MNEEFKVEMMAMAKARGLDLAEETVADLAELALDIVGLVIKKSTNSYDDLLWAAMEAKVREVLVALIDKIDGQVG